MSSLNDNTRIEPDDVRAIFTTDLLDESLIEFINMAAEITDDVAATASSISAQRLRMIEMNMAAHLASSDDPRTLQESVGDVSAMYVRDNDVTEYLKTAADLDPTSVITVSRQSKANIHVPDGR